MKTPHSLARYEVPLFWIAALCTLLLGLVWMLFPAILLASLNLPRNSELVYPSRRYAALFIGTALFLSAARNDPTRPARRAILMGSFISSLLRACMSLYGVFTAIINATGWISFALETLLASGFGYALFIRTDELN